MLMCFCSCNREEDKRDALYKEITSVNKLVLSSMAINKIGEYDDESNWKIGKRIAVYSYDTYMRAYIDLSLLKPEDFVIDETAKTAELTLPAGVSRTRHSNEGRALPRNWSAFADRLQRACRAERKNERIPKKGSDAQSCFPRHAFGCRTQKGCPVFWQDN